MKSLISATVIVLWSVTVTAAYYLGTTRAQRPPEQHVAAIVVPIDGGDALIKTSTGEILVYAKISRGPALEEVVVYSAGGPVLDASFGRNKQVAEVTIKVDKRPIERLGYYENGKLKFRSRFDPIKPDAAGKSGTIREDRQYFDEQGNESKKEVCMLHFAD